MTSSGNFTALLVDDHSADAELLETRIREMDWSALGGSVRVIREGTAASACASLRYITPSIIILELVLPDAHGLEALKRIREVSSAPLIVLTGISSEGFAARALRGGAQDYVVKPVGDRLSVRHMILMAIERHRIDLERDATLREAQRAAVFRDRAVKVVSHDLRTPLSTIRMCAAALQDPVPPDADGVRDMASLIDQSALWSQQIVHDLLERDSIDSGGGTLQRVPVDPAVLLERARMLFTQAASAREITLDVQCAESLAPVHGDPRRLLQILSNLIENAIKFSPSHGRVTLVASHATQSVDDAQLGRPRGVRFAVTDSGDGIPYDELARVFDWFWTSPRRNSDGRGLGLAIADPLVKAHGSHLQVRSTAGHGTSFSFVIAPVAAYVSAPNALLPSNE